MFNATRLDNMKPEQTMEVLDAIIEKTQIYLSAHNCTNKYLISTIKTTCLIACESMIKYDLKIECKSVVLNYIGNINLLHSIL